MKLAKIIRMEFLLTVANKVFVILTLVGPFLIAALTILPGFLLESSVTPGSSIIKIALAGTDSNFIGELAPALLQSGIEVKEVQNGPEFLDSQLLSGAYDGYILFPADITDIRRLEYVSMDSTDFNVSSALQAVLGQAIVAMKLTKAGVPVAQIASLTQQPVVESLRLKPNGIIEKKPTFIALLMASLMFSMLLYMTVLLYGQAIGRSVLAEKTNKTVEIMLSSVRSTDLLFGKILGKALASLLQYGIWVASSILVLKLSGSRFLASTGIVLSLGTFAYLLLFFILAFFLYCSIYAALGAASQDEQQLGQLAWPVVLFLMIPVVLIPPVINAPRSPLIMFLSFFPLTSPIIMFLRILMDAVQPWEILVSVIMLLVTTAAVVWLSSKIFRVGILMTGKRFKLHKGGISWVK